MFLHLLIATTAFSIGLFFIKKSAGTFNLGKINLIHFIFILFILQIFLGATLLKLGFTNHYTHRYLLFKTDSINLLFYSAVLTMVLWPLSTFGFLRLFKTKPTVDYNKYLKKDTTLMYQNYSFIIILLLSVLSLIFLYLYLLKIGYVPIIKLISKPAEFSFGTERIRIKNLVIINTVVRNIIVLTLIPLLSYITFSFAIASRKIKWIILAIILFVASIITKTYNFEKGPIVFHLAIYFFIIIYQFGGIKKRHVFAFGISSILLLVSAYSLLGSDLTLNLYDGIIGRIVMTPAGMLALHFDMFPKVFGFLNGRSAPNILLSLFGLGSESRVRSSRLLMEFYGSEAVFENTAGVMSTFFLGESYANFGFIGVVFSIVWLGLVLALLFAFFTKFRKTPVSIAIFSYFSVHIALASQGGFFDFVYNVNWVFIFLLMLMLEYGPQIIDLIKNKLLSNSTRKTSN